MLKIWHQQTSFSLYGVVAQLVLVFFVLVRLLSRTKWVLVFHITSNNTSKDSIIKNFNSSTLSLTCRRRHAAEPWMTKVDLIKTAKSASWMTVMSPYRSGAYLQTWRIRYKTRLKLLCNLKLLQLYQLSTCVHMFLIFFFNPCFHGYNPASSVLP